ncbi:hypothetical protein C2L80_13455, partial [Rubneribacter badeniensis]
MTYLAQRTRWQNHAFCRYFFERGCGQKVGHSGVRIGVRMYPLETRELAVEAVAAGFSLTEAA